MNFKEIILGGKKGISKEYDCIYLALLKLHDYGDGEQISDWEVLGIRVVVVATSRYLLGTS